MEVAEILRIIVVSCTQVICLICTPPRAWVYISGKSRGHVIQLICTMPMQAKSLQANNHPNQYEAGHQINYIDQLVKFDYGTVTTNVVTMFVNIYGQILRISWKHSI